AAVPGRTWATGRLRSTFRANRTCTTALRRWCRWPDSVSQGPKPNGVRPSRRCYDLRGACRSRRGARRMKTRLSLRINGEEYDLVAPVHKTLLEVLREELDLTGTKHGCELGECGTCAVLVDGEPIL